MTITILPTQNTEWGFFSTIGRVEHDPAAPGSGSGQANAAKAWEIASRAIAEATQGSPEGVRDFLDSRHGRHFADDVANALWAGETTQAAMEGTVNRWMAWTIDRNTARDHGIPRGLPYLTGFVTHFAIMGEAD